MLSQELKYTLVRISQITDNANNTTKSNIRNLNKINYSTPKRTRFK